MSEYEAEKAAQAAFTAADEVVKAPDAQTLEEANARIKGLAFAITALSAAVHESQRP